MDSNVRKYYETVCDLCVHDGWNILVDEMQTEQQLLIDQLSIEEDLIKIGRLQGQISILTRLRNLKDTAEKQYEMLQEEKSESEE